MSVDKLNRIIKPASALLSSFLLLAACSGDGRPLEEAVEANNLLLKTVSIVPPPGLLSDLIVNPGTQVNLSLRAINQLNLPVSVTSTNRRWSIRNGTDSNATVGSINDAGSFLAISEGDAFVSVRIGGIGSQEFKIAVRDEFFDSIETIEGDASMERCLPKPYNALGRFLPVNGVGEGSLRGLPSAEWDILNKNIGSVSTPVDGFARATGVNQGTLQLIAIFEEIKSDPKLITIEDTLMGIRIEPDVAGLTIGSTTLDLIAKANYMNGDIDRDNIDITESVQWLAEEDNTVLQVSNVVPTKGRVSSLTVGSASVTAACGNVQDVKQVVVGAAGSTTSTVLSFEGDSPLVLPLAIGSRQLRLSTGSEYDEDTEKTTDEDTEWTVLLGASVVSINTTNAKGVLTLLNAGSATIQATYNGLVKKLEIQVLP